MRNFEKNLLKIYEEGIYNAFESSEEPKKCNCMGKCTCCDSDEDEMPPEHKAEMGYGEDEENSHDETDLTNPEEKEEVKIGKEIIHLAGSSSHSHDPKLQKIVDLAKKLLEIHGVE